MYKENPYPDERKIEGKIDPNAELGRAISRCFFALSIGDDMLLASALDAVKIAVPNNLKFVCDEIEEECTVVVPKWVRPKNPGLYMLSKDPLDPVIDNRRGVDLDYNPERMGRRFEFTKDEEDREGGEEGVERGGPNWISPLYVKEEVTDHRLMFRYVLTELENNGLWWQERMEDVT